MGGEGKGDNDGAEGGGAPLSWFGANASPSVAKGRSAFSDVLRLAVAAANARGALLELAEGASGDSRAPR